MSRSSILAVFVGLLALLAACSPGGTAPPEPLDVLYYYDGFFADDPYVRDALDAEEHTVTQTSDATVFGTELTTGDWDLVIVLNQDNDLEVDSTALEAYVDGGGSAIFADWTMTADAAAIFDASYTGNTNLTTADLAAGLDAGITDPVVLENPGWGTYSMGLSAEAGGTSACTFENGDSCLVLGNGGRTAILGFLADTLPADDGERFWINLVDEVAVP